jgi:uncharacterized protein (DUF2147 family)
MKYSIFLVLLFTAFTSCIKAQIKQDAIVGKWMSTENNLLVEVYKCGNDFKAKVLWFDDSDDRSNPYNTRMDSNNPDHTLRTRKILGMEVLHGLAYNTGEDRWEDGRIYDSKSGKTWDASAWITRNHLLKVRGFWHFEFLGETMKFKKYQAQAVTKN